MATTVGQHSVAAFTSPINGTTPIDANTVRSNDNTVRLAYVDHDADTGIHVQSSTLASRPVAGTAGRKWITDESGVYTLWFDDGVNWHPVSSEAVALTVLCTTALNRGDVVKVVGWNNGQDLPEVAKVASSSDIAFAVMTQNATINTMGYAINTGTLQDIDTAAFAVGNILYPNTTGGFTTTKPTSGVYQPVAFVLRSNATNGVIYVEFSAPRIVEVSTNTASTVVLRDGSGNFSAGAITASSLAGTLTTAAQPNITSVGTLSTLTVSGAITASGGTANSVAYLNASKVLSTSANLTYDGTTLSIYNGTVDNQRLNISMSGTNVALNATRTSGTVPQMLFQIDATERMRIEGNGNLAVDTNTLFVDATNNRVGVGTVSPASALEVTGAVRTGADASSVSLYTNTGWRHTGSSGLFIDANQGGAANGVFIRNGSGLTTQLTLDASGNLGLGVTPSAWASAYSSLDMRGASFFGSTTATEASIAANTYVATGGNYTYKATASSTLYQQVLGEHRWSTAASGTAGNTISFTRGMTLDASGNLLVGPTATVNGAKLLVAGSCLSTGNSLTTFSGAQGGFDWVSRELRLFSGTPDATGSFITFWTGVSGSINERLRIDSVGNVGIGATPSTASIRTLQVVNTSLSSPGTAMYLTANAVFDSPNWKYISSTFSSQYVQINGGHQWLNAASGTAGANVSFTQAMTLDASGNLGIGGVPGSYRLDVVGSMRCYGDVLSSAAGVATFGTLTNQSLRLATNNTFRVEIDTSGNVGVGATPSYRLDAQVGAGSGNIFRAGQTSVSNGYTITTNGTALTHAWANAGTNTMTLDTSGNLALASGYMRVAGASAGAASTTTIGNTTATTVGAAGGASALPATPLGYIIAHVGTTQVKIPYYTA